MLVCASCQTGPQEYSSDRVRELSRSLRAGNRNWSLQALELVAMGPPAARELGTLLEVRPDPLLDVVRDRILAESTVIGSWGLRHVVAAESALASQRPRDAFRGLSALALLASEQQDNFSRRLRKEAQRQWLHQVIELQIDVPAVVALESPVTLTASIVNRSAASVEIVVPREVPMVGYLELETWVMPITGYYRREMSREGVEAEPFILEPGAANVVEFELLPPATLGKLPFAQRFDLRMSLRPAFFRTPEHEFSCFLESSPRVIYRIPEAVLGLGEDPVAALEQSLMLLEQVDLPEERLPDVRRDVFYAGFLSYAEPERALPLLQQSLSRINPGDWPDDEKMLRVLIGFYRQLPQLPDRESCLPE